MEERLRLEKVVINSNIQVWIPIGFQYSLTGVGVEPLRSTKPSYQFSREEMAAVLFYIKKLYLYEGLILGSCASQGDPFNAQVLPL